MDRIPVVSIIVPVYKVPVPLLRGSVESCMKQTMQEIEILLVDDGSPDACGDICDEYAASDHRIRVIHQENRGLAGARNAGQREAAGEWIMFVDGDDWIEPDMCSTMYAAAVRENVQMVLCGMVREYGRSSEHYRYYIQEKAYRGEDCRWLQQQLLVFSGNIATAYAKLIRRDCLMEHGIFHDEKLRQGAEGLEFNLRVFEELESAFFLDRPFYHYIYNPDSISASHDEKNHQYVLSCFRSIRSFIDRSKNREALLPWFENRLLYVIITTAVSGYFNPANEEPFSEKKRKFAAYLRDPMITQALKTDNTAGLSHQRRIALFLIRHHMYFSLYMMGVIRRKQKLLR